MNKVFCFFEVGLVLRTHPLQEMIILWQHNHHHGNWRRCLQQDYDFKGLDLHFYPLLERQACTSAGPLHSWCMRGSGGLKDRFPRWEQAVGEKHCRFRTCCCSISFRTPFHQAKQTAFNFFKSVFCCQYAAFSTTPTEEWCFKKHRWAILGWWADSSSIPRACCSSNS